MSESKQEACAALSEHLVAFVDGELAGAELETVKAHVATCLPCRREIESIEKVGQLVGALPRIEPSAKLAARFQDRLQGSLQESLTGTTTTMRPPLSGTTGSTIAHTTPRAPRTPGWAVAFAAAAVVMLALGSVLQQGMRSTSLMTDAVSDEVVLPEVVDAGRTLERVHALRNATADDASVHAVARMRHEAARVASAGGAFGKLTSEALTASLPEHSSGTLSSDVPSDLLARPELYLRLPVVRRLETLEHFHEVRLYSQPDRVGSARHRMPRAQERSGWS